MTNSILYSFGCILIYIATPILIIAISLDIILAWKDSTND